jgi:hypothetical protein
MWTHVFFFKMTFHMNSYKSFYRRSTTFNLNFCHLESSSCQIAYENGGWMVGDATVPNRHFIWRYIVSFAKLCGGQYFCKIIKYKKFLIPHCSKSLRRPKRKRSILLPTLRQLHSFSLDSKIVWTTPLISKPFTLPLCSGYKRISKMVLSFQLKINLVITFYTRKNL